MSAKPCAQSITAGFVPGSAEVVLRGLNRTQHTNQWGLNSSWKSHSSFFHPEGGEALNRLPKEAVDAPSLQAVKARLDVALGSLVCWLATLHIAGGWNWMSIVVLFTPGHSMSLWILWYPTMTGSWLDCNTLSQHQELRPAHRPFSPTGPEA